MNDDKFTDEIDFSDISDMPHLGSEPLAFDVPNDAPSAFLASKGYIQPTTVPVSYVSADWSDPLVSKASADLVVQEREILRKYNVGESEQLFEDGKAFLQIGHDTIEAEDAAYNALPSFEDACAAFTGTILAECRRDLVGDLRKMRLDHEGKLVLLAPVDGVDPLTLEDNAWRQLATKAGSQNINAGLTARQAPAPMRIRTRRV